MLVGFFDRPADGDAESFISLRIREAGSGEDKTVLVSSEDIEYGGKEICL